MDDFRTILLILLGLGSGWLLFWVRTSFFRPKPLFEDALARAASALGLNGRAGVYRGIVKGLPVSVQRLPERDGRIGVRITVTVNTSFDGEIRLAGPSENAGSGTPEVKILIGDGRFDHHFWVAKSTPKNAATDLLLPLTDVRSVMLELPFGIWAFAGKTRSYQSYKLEPADYPNSIPEIISALSRVTN